MEEIEELVRKLEGLALRQVEIARRLILGLIHAFFCEYSQIFAKSGCQWKNFAKVDLRKWPFSWYEGFAKVFAKIAKV